MSLVIEKSFLQFLAKMRGIGLQGKETPEKKTELVRS